MITKVIDEQQVKAVCDVLGETSLGFTKTELTRLLQQCGIEIVSDGKSSNGYVYQVGLNKRDWLYNCLVNEINKSHTLFRVYTFIEKSLNPVSFTNSESRTKYEYLLEETNKALLLAGLQVSKEGKLIEVIQAKTLDEVDRRVNSLKKQLYNRLIHSEV
ncbi:hypothetical protein [Clostridium sp.]|uniref:hypothetical protein n=1 Tax=Clostridium sp. TaxID=1506 RepID=UPI0032162800